MTYEINQSPITPATTAPIRLALEKAAKALIALANEKTIVQWPSIDSDEPETLEALADVSGRIAKVCDGIFSAIALQGDYQHLSSENTDALVTEVVKETLVYEFERQAENRMDEIEEAGGCRNPESGWRTHPGSL